MKNAGLLFLFWIGLLIPMKAQITITNAVFPVVGDTLHYFFGNQAGAINQIFTPPGGNQAWDLSNLQATQTWNQIFEDASTGSVFGDFPTADLVYETTTPNVDAYLNVTAQQVQLLGYSPGSAAVYGLPLVANYGPPIVTQRDPVNFFDINQISSGILLPFLPGLMPNVGLLPFTADSLRIRTAINRLDVVDAWGTLTIPGGTYDVLREKRTQYTEARLDAKVPPLGWLDVTDIAIQVLNLPLGVDTLVSFHFLNNVSKEAIAICTLNTAQNTVTGIQYKNVAPAPPPPTCDDNIQNGDETGIDCGGSVCHACPPAPTCFDNIQNGDETGIDCGGSVCPQCPSGPTCFDNIQNGDETGIDCGGSFCEPCVVCDQYVILSEENMEIKRTIIHSGGIGVLNEDEFAEINEQSRVIAAGTFVKAPDVDVNGGSQVNTIIEEQADPCLPEFLYNTNPSNNDVDVDEDETVTLNAAIYDDIEVEDGATVIFSGHQNVYIDDFDAGSNVTVIFNQCTNLRVKKEFRLGSQTDFNTANVNVAVFSEDKIALEGRNIAKGLFYTKEEVIIHKAKSSDRNKLYGQFIGREVDVAQYTDMYFQLYVPCNQPAPLMAQEEGNIEALGQVLAPNGQSNGLNPGETKGASNNISSLSVAPNPFNSETNISFRLDQEDYVVIGIYNLNGQLVNQLVSGILPAGSHQLNWNGDTREGKMLENGIYLVILKTNEQVITEKVILVK